MSIVKNRQQQVEQVLKDHGDWMTTKDVAKALKIESQVASCTLQRMYREKKIKKKKTFGMIDSTNFNNRHHMAKMVVWKWEEN